MSDRPILRHFGHGADGTAIALPFDLDALVADWGGLRRKMVRDVPPAFSRDEWAYLVGFVAPDALWAVFNATFGPPRAAAPITRLLRPRGPIALWLPNNVSLLGPLTLILASLTGNPLRVKAGSRSDDLCSALVQWALAKLEPGPLRSWLERDVLVQQMPRDDPRQARWSAEAAVRIVFGSDAAARAIADLPAAPTAALFAFVDRQSQAWCEVAALDDEALLAFIRVFSIYGRAGCTSPARLVLVDGDEAACQRVAARLIGLWPRAVRADVAMHHASANVLSLQTARSMGWRADAAPRNAAVVCTCPSNLDDPPGHLVLPVVCASLDAAVAALPANIQTVGHMVVDAAEPRWPQALAGTPVCRFVPVGQMHHFGPVWDGFAFWRQLFEDVEIST